MDVAELIITRGGKTLIHMRIDRAEVCIGSNPTSDVVIPDPSIPEAVALLMDRGGRRFRLRDLTGGRLGVNGASLEGDEIELDDGAVVGIGTYELRLAVRREEGRLRFGRTDLLTPTRPASEENAELTFEGRRFRLSAARPFNIGGHEDNDLVIEDAFVSSFHARIARRQGRWFVSDLDSTNGTLVNELRVNEAELPKEATLRLGKLQLGFRAGVDDAPPDEDADRGFHGMIGESAKMRRLFDLIRRIADAPEPVLIVGASGTGKELVARALHDASTRASGPYLALNCGALTPSLVESELFGYVKGIYTGADRDKAGAFEATTGGTLFLDEIGELPYELQPKLLRVLETGAIRRVGGTEEIPVDTRVVAATHRNLEELVAAGQFREDLFHRLFVLSVSVPSLAARPDDVIPIARHLLGTQAPRPIRLTAAAEAALRDYTWPGNIRELRNVLVRAIFMTDGEEIDASDLQFSRDAFTTRSKDARRSVRRNDQQERARILEALTEAAGNRAEAARILGVSKSTFHDRLKRYGIGNKFAQRK